jgi:hypothetical protein
MVSSLSHIADKNKLKTREDIISHDKLSLLHRQNHQLHDCRIHFRRGWTVLVQKRWSTRFLSG